MKTNDDWIDNFIHSFGQQTSNSFELRNQTDFVQQQNATEDRSQINQINKDNESKEKQEDENLNTHAEDESTGDEYVLELTRTQIGPDKKDVSVTFSCLNNKNKYVSSTLGSLCEGIYSAYSNQSLKIIASALCKDYDFIFNYIDTSLAKYSDTLDSNTAIKIASLAKDKDGMISDIDYKKIKSKLSSDGIKEFHEKLDRANMKIYATNFIKTASSEQ